MNLLHRRHFKIRETLILYFAAALLTFALVIGIVFLLLFRNYTITVHKQDMQQQASQIADNASSYISEHHGMAAKGVFFRFLNELSGSDVWLIDKDYNLITPPSGHGGGRHNSSSAYQYSNLPANADQLVQRVFEDEVAFTDEFSSLLSEVSLTVGVPIKSQSSGEVIGVVLLHSPVRGTEDALRHDFTTLGISMVIALAITLVLSVRLSGSFTKPLEEMKQTALLLADGNYSAKTNLHRSDEIGDLAAVLDLLSEELAAASKQSGQLEMLRNQLIANISHELRTPVTVIRGSLEALLDQVVSDPEQIEEYYRQMLNESIYLQRLIGDLMELSRLQNTDFEIRKEPLLLYDTLDDAVRSARQLSAAQNIMIELEKETASPEFPGDYGRLRQMFLIVLDNAVKFSPANATIRVKAAGGTITITDHGIGIPAEELPYLFDRFYRSRSEQNKTGTGLGLAIARQIAARHDMTITVSSEPGKGTEFTFECN